MSAIPEVPAAYRGVWKRTLLRTPQIEDASSQVYWLQTGNWHADIRVPVTRPACAGKHALDALDRDELLGLATQQGFAGITVIEGDTCRWLRQHDFQPPSGRNDIGRMVFDTPDRLFEYGVETEYFEVWERVAGSSAAPFRVVTDEETGALCLIAGNFFITVRARASQPPIAESLLSVAGNCTDAELRALLDFEIAFGEKNDKGEGRIALCTHPWLEGRSRPLPRDRA